MKSTTKIRALLKLEKSIPQTRKDGAICWKLPTGELHREFGPAIVWPNGREEYFIKDQHHRKGGGPTVIDPETGITHFHCRGKKHNIKGPAVLGIDYKEWWVNNKLHRLDGPAVIEKESKRYYLNGERIYLDIYCRIIRLDYDRNRDDPDELLTKDAGKPVESKDGTISWHLADGTLHRDFGPALIKPNGDYTYYKNGIIQRDNGPAKFEDGTSFYYKQGKLHRLDGPAVEQPAITFFINQYWVEGKLLMAEDRPMNKAEFIKYLAESRLTLT